MVARKRKPQTTKMAAYVNSDTAIKFKQLLIVQGTSFSAWMREKIAEELLLSGFTDFDYSMLKKKILGKNKKKY